MEFGALLQHFSTVIWPPIKERIIELALAPTVNPEMMWIVTPLVIVTVLMAFYFGKYHEEELGWNTAVGNSLVLLFVAMDLLRHIYNLEAFVGFGNFIDQPIKTAICIGIAVEGILLMFTNMLHFLPKKVAFLISSPTSVNLQAYIAVAIVYTNVPFDRTTILAGVALFIMLYVGFGLIKLSERAFFGSIQWAKEQEEKEELHKAKKLLEKKEHLIKEEIKEDVDRLEKIEVGKEENELEDINDKPKDSPIGGLIKKFSKK